MDPEPPSSGKCMDVWEWACKYKRAEIWCHLSPEDKESLQDEIDRMYLPGEAPPPTTPYIFGMILSYYMEPSRWIDGFPKSLIPVARIIVDATSFHNNNR